MLLVVHASVGAIIGKKVSHAGFAFIMSFVAHFLMDFVPHGDHEIVRNYQQKKQMRQLYFFLLSDVFATLFFITAIILAESSHLSASMTWGLIGGILPDLLMVSFFLTKGKLLKRFAKLHNKIHCYLEDQKSTTISMGYGLVIQFLIMIYFMGTIF